MRRQRHRHTRQGGFTLIELMITVAIVAILATIATASYSRYVLRANRTEARMALLSIQAAQEKYFLQNGKYAQDLATVIASPAKGGLGVPLDAKGYTSGGHYVVSFTGAADTTYTVQAAATGSQAKDSAACLTFSVTEQGTFTPAAGTTCWH